MTVEANIDNSASRRPSNHVLQAFGVDGLIHKLEGGQGEAFLASGLVLKYVNDPIEAVWIQHLTAQLDQNEVRLAKPVQTSDGSWECQSWTASEFIPDLVPAAPNWGVVVSAGEAFTRAVSVASEVDTSVLSRRTHRWAKADRYAWDEEELDLPGPVQEIAHTLQQLTSQLDRPNQIIHADLSGNVFLDASHKPVVLDISPYIRPADWAEAIVVADSILWWKEPVEVAAEYIERTGNSDLLARALIFRLAAESWDRDEDMSGLLSSYYQVVLELTR